MLDPDQGQLLVCLPIRSLLNVGRLGIPVPLGRGGCQLISISQLGANVANLIRGKTKTLSKTPILLTGIAVAVILQVVFSQWGVMNNLFHTAPLTGQQWLICLAPMIPMIPMAIFANWLDPEQDRATTSTAQR